MSEERRKVEPQRISSSSDNESEDSMEFQELETGENQSIMRVADDREDEILTRSSENKNQQKIKIYEAQLEEKICKLEKQLKIRQQQLENERREKKQYYRLYQKILSETTGFKEQIDIEINQNDQLKDINSELKNLCKELKEENEDYVEKINLLQKKILIEKQDIQSKFVVIRRNLQPFTRLSLKKLEPENVVKLMTTQCGQIEKILQKLADIDQMIIQKSPKSKNAPDGPDLLQQKYTIVEKVQTLLIKQQGKINALKEYNLSLEQQLKEAKKSSNSLSTGIGKIFNPVMKFCKAEEPNQTQIKKRRDNM